MNAKFIYLVMISMLSIGFVSCGDDDEKKPELPDSVQKQTNATYNVVIGANSKFEQAKTLKLSDILSATEAQYAKKGELQFNTSKIKITGVSQVQGSPNLNDFTLEVKGSQNKISLGTIKSDTTFTNNTSLDFMQKAINQMVNNKTADVTVSFTSTTNINSTDNVKVELSFDAIYTFK